MGLALLVAGVGLGVAIPVVFSMDRLRSRNCACAAQLITFCSDLREKMLSVVVVAQMNRTAAIAGAR